MTVSQARRVWTEQCHAASSIRERYGVKSAFDYLVAEKLLNFAEAAGRSPEFARELPGFVAAVRSTFAPEEMQTHLDRIERELARQQSADRSEDADLDPDEFLNDAARAEERSARLATIKQLLVAAQLGIA